MESFEQFRPDYRFDHFSQITPDWLKEKQIRTLLSDLDSTLTPHDEMGDAVFEEWLKKIQAADITLIIVSNNTQARVDAFTDTYQLVGYGQCQKPSTGVIEKELFEKGLDPETTVFLGDQLFTDMWCGKLLGIRRILVKPIPGKETLRIKLKRVVEKKIMKSWETNE